MRKVNNQNQLTIGIEIWEEIENQKATRRKRLTKTVFDRNQLSFDDLDLVTFDISCKDFEFFYAYILQQEWYTDIKVSENDRDMVDIRAKKDKKNYLIQCKQWTSKDISVQQVAEMYSKMYHEYYKNKENTIMQIITTSYFDKYAWEFLEGNCIEWVNNIQLIQLCEKWGYFNNEKWMDIKVDIYKRRLNRLKGTMLERKQSLWQLRYYELLKHTRNGWDWLHFYTKSPKSQDFLKNHFFQYWDLV